MLIYSKTTYFGQTRCLNVLVDGEVFVWDCRNPDQWKPARFMTADWATWFWYV